MAHPMLKIPILVSEIFASFQGEGISLGEPCVFLRLGHCNLKCTWCDTKYTWDWKNYDIRKELTALNANQALELILRAAGKNQRLIVTGGEPLLQQENAELLTVLKTLQRKKWIIEVETNGTIVPNKEWTKIVDQWNVSPKLSHSKNEILLRETGALSAFAIMKNAYFKFVVESVCDMVEINDWVKKYELEGQRVFLMPQARTKAALKKKKELIERLAAKWGYLASNRSHVEKFGKKRGK